MKKILVIGCPGSGKTSLCIRLAKMSGLPLVHLDRHYHDANLWSADLQRKREQWKDWIVSQIQSEKWIMDGNYKSTLDVRIPAADTVIFLDYPRYVCLWRIFMRRFFTAHSREDMPSLWKEKIGWDLIRFAWFYNKEERPRVLELLQRNQVGKMIVVLRHPSDSEAVLTSITTTGSTSHPRS